jgi:Holliday junction DNA helicase RuvA
MIEQILGRLVHKSGSAVHLDTGPLVLEVQTPLSTLETIGDEGSVVRLFAHLLWREDGPTLFGFAQTEERHLFRLLLQVQGVGPRIALAILGHLPPPDLIRSLKDRSETAFTLVPGVGKKTAGRILVELGPVADKLELAARVVTLPRHRVEEDAVQALTALGYSPKDALRALEAVLSETGSTRLEEQIRLALQKLTRDGKPSPR